MGDSIGELIVRADATTGIGTGHLMRSLALAQAWQDAGGSVAFITVCDSEGLRRRLREEGFTLFPLAKSHPGPGDWEETEAILGRHSGAGVVLDGYHFDTGYQEGIRAAGHPLLVIDDMAHLPHYAADVLLNQNLHAAGLTYSVESDSRLLLETGYALLRREFLKWRGCPREIPAVARHVLVTMGGTDPGNITLEAIKVLSRAGETDLEVAVVMGAGNPHAGAVEAAAWENNLPVRLIYDARNMPELMAWADLAISAAGTTVWELMFLGVPSVLMAVAGNQEMIAASAAAAGAAVRVEIKGRDWSDVFAENVRKLIPDASHRAELSARGRRLVDGLGGQRVVQAMTERMAGRCFR
ncbi:UDP-2,4-diacetamido-2,4,6-trideoxy-beta-L-altropyranose hydrolase [Chloroflexota bacterium]